MSLSGRFAWIQTVPPMGGIAIAFKFIEARDTPNIG